MTTYSLREGELLAFRHGDEHLTLNRANPSVMRPTQQPLQRAG